MSVCLWDLILCADLLFVFLFYLWDTPFSPFSPAKQTTVSPASGCHLLANVIQHRLWVWLLACTGRRKQNTTLFCTRSTGTQENINLHKCLILLQETCLSTLTWRWCTSACRSDLLSLLSPLPSVSLLFKYKPAAAGQPDSAILFERWPYCGHQECLRVIWEQTNNYTITLRVMLSVKCLSHTHSHLSQCNIRNID